MTIELRGMARGYVEMVMHTRAFSRCLVGFAALVGTLAGASPRGYTVEEQALDSGRIVTIVLDGHRFAAPATEPEQEGAEQPKVSPDGRTVGWVALTSNCCTSYPLPTVLVLYRDGKVLRRVGIGEMMIYTWAFGPRSDEVVVQRGLPHGPEYFHFIRTRISDGRQLAEYECGAEFETREPRPAWSRAIRVECPAYEPAMEQGRRPGTAASASSPPLK